MPGRWVRIEPISVWGFYVLPRSATPEFLPPMTVNIATYNASVSTTLAAASDSGENTGRTQKVTDWEVQGGSLAHYRMYCLDSLTAFRIYQPQAHGRMDSKNKTLMFDKRLTDYAIKTGNLQFLPELFLLEDQVNPSIQALNMDPNEATGAARLGVVGWRYPLIKIDHTKTDANGKPLYPPPNRIPAVTIYIANKQ